MKHVRFNLDERLIDYAVKTISITETMSGTRAGNYLAAQLVRSCTSPALHYGEAQSAESRNDFIHKIKILLKELRESINALKIIRLAKLAGNMNDIDNAITETNELIAIFVKSVATARKNKAHEK